MTSSRMSGARIRPAGESDAQTLADLGARTFYEAYIDMVSAEVLEPFIESAFDVDVIRAELEAPSVTFLIAEVDGAIAGYAMVDRGDAPEPVTGHHPAELARIYVGEEWIGRGIGTELMRASLDHAERSGCDVVWLGVWEHNQRAIGFYEQWGFRTIGHTSFRLGDVLQTDILMERATTDAPGIADRSREPAGHRTPNTEVDS